MCGRYSLIHGMSDLAKRFGFDPGGLTITPRYNMAPGQMGLVVVEDEAGRWGRTMKWGLVPQWARAESDGYKMINARGETVAQKPAFKGLLRSRRCLIPVDGFYEWKRKSGKKAKQPFRFVVDDASLFALAGLWSAWWGPDEMGLLTYTIITTKANSLVIPYHDRMPVILTGQAQKLWLDPALTDVRAITELIRPNDPAGMSVQEVSSLVNSVKNDGPEVLIPDNDVQPGLF